MALRAARHTHVLYDMWLDDVEPLKWVDTWQALLPALAEESGATVIGQRFHQFKPWGVTGILLLAESHISVHTWPEHGLAAIDIFTCGEMDTQLILKRLRERFSPRHEKLTNVQRGDPGESP